MRLLYMSLILLLLSSITYAVEQNTLDLPNDIPFKKSLTLTTLLLFDSPQENTKMVAELGTKLTDYAILESKAKEVVKPLVTARKKYKQTVSNTIFKNDQDLKNVIKQIQQTTDENTAHNIQELYRDNLIQFNEHLEPVASSVQYTNILEVAQQYQSKQFELKKHPLFAVIEKARQELKVLMNDFLHKNYKTIQQLQEEFNVSVKKVNVYLNTVQNQ